MVRKRDTDRCRAAHELGELGSDFRGCLDLLNTPAISELRIRVVNGVFMVLRS